MTALFQLVDVTHYYGRVCALRDVSLAVEPGAIGLIGQNGAGKSTLIQILLGLIRPTRGSAHVLGEDLRTAGIRLRGRVGYMPERDAMVPGLNGIEFAALAGELCGMSRKQALRRAHEALSFLGLEEARYRKLEQYSAGMRQRLKLAATLVHDPDVLLLDEPTAGLDPEGRAAMLSLLTSLAARPGKSLVLSTHLLGDVERVCDRAIVLDQGQVKCAGRIAELRAGRQRCYRIRWEGDATGFLAALRQQEAKLCLGSRENEAQVILPDGWTTHALFVQADLHKLVLTGLEPIEEDLEAVYRRMIWRHDEPGAIVTGECAAAAQGE